jgi:plastocyanin
VRYPDLEQSLLEVWAMSFRKLVGGHLAVALLVAGVALAGTVQDSTVQITEKGYIPARVEIVVGQKVVFRNVTQKDHSLSSKAPAGETDKDKTEFDSGVIKASTSWEHTFSKEGTYTYFCKEDKSMTGTIVVSSAK